MRPRVHQCCTTLCEAHAFGSVRVLVCLFAWNDTEPLHISPAYNWATTAQGPTAPPSVVTSPQPALLHAPAAPCARRLVPCLAWHTTRPRCQGPQGPAARRSRRPPQQRQPMWPLKSQPPPWTVRTSLGRDQCDWGDRGGGGHGQARHGEVHANVTQ